MHELGTKCEGFFSRGGGRRHQHWALCGPWRVSCPVRQRCACLHLRARGAAGEGRARLRVGASGVWGRVRVCVAFLLCFL